MRKYLIFIFILIVFLFAACKSQPQPEPVVRQVVPEPVVVRPVEPQPVVPEPVIEVIEPLFEIISIAIIQGELVNTLFESVLKIDNPNEFAVELSALKYELHGNGLFWADGIENDILHVPAKSSLETKFRFSMNFIDMNRRLLDDIIAMRQVRYNFKGNALVQAVIPRVPPFSMDFDCAGMSEVRPRAD